MPAPWPPPGCASCTVPRSVARSMPLSAAMSATVLPAANSVFSSSTLMPSAFASASRISSWPSPVTPLIAPGPAWTPGVGVVDPSSPLWATASPTLANPRRPIAVAAPLRASFFVFVFLVSPCRFRAASCRADPNLDAGAHFTVGRTSVNAEPLPGPADSVRSVPPIALARALAIVKPTPVPPEDGARDPPTR